MLGMDVVLRDKLFESGALERITPLLQEGDGAVRISILFALSSLANYGSFGSRRTIAELTTPTLIDIISNSDCSASDARLSMVILARGLGTVLLETSLKYTPGEQVNTPELLCNLDGKRACFAIGAVIRRSDVDTEVVWRGTSILRSLAFYFRDAVLATHTERLFVAALASKDIQVRLDGLLGILRLGASVAQLESQQVKPMHVAAIAHSPETYFTPELMQAVRSQHGWLKGGMIQEILESVILLDEAIVRLEKTGDAVGFGRTLSKRVLTCEYSFSKGRVSDLEREREPLANYFERAAEALATSGDPGDTHLSFVLLVKLAMVLNDREKVLKLSAEGLKRHSESAFFYYAQTTVIRDSRTSLRLAMQGLACSDLTDYVKRVLLERSAEAAYHMTITDDPNYVLANWLARTAQDNEDVTWAEFAEIRPQDSEMLALGTGAQDAFLYRCSLCGNPSASLKRCGRCKQARYCDDNCQRKHWKKGHKLVCKPA
ncbi:hypothetical protein FRC09_012256 [Ceratobasidium sp. 395]|nr:hypothetical protein FRC09_012256 [Ceratobasidium sp. 395]